MWFLLKLLFILVLALTLPIMGLFLLGHSWFIGLAFIVMPTVIAYHLA